MPIKRLNKTYLANVLNTLSGGKLNELRIEAIKAAKCKTKADINDQTIVLDQEFSGILSNPIFPLTGSR